MQNREQRQNSKRKPLSAGDIAFLCLLGAMFLALGLLIYEFELWKTVTPADPIQIGEPQ